MSSLNKSEKQISIPLKLAKIYIVVAIATIIYFGIFNYIYLILHHENTFFASWGYFFGAIFGIFYVGPLAIGAKAIYFAYAGRTWWQRILLDLLSAVVICLPLAIAAQDYFLMPLLGAVLLAGIIEAT